MTRRDSGRSSSWSRAMGLTSRERRASDPASSLNPAPRLSMRSDLMRRPVAGAGLRFVLSGATVALVYTATTLLLADVVGLPFEVALVTGYAVGLATHFTLQRLFVWVHAAGFALPL